MSKNRNRRGNNVNTKPSNTDSGSQGFKPEQPRKDSGSRRINADNARVDRVADAIEADSKKPSANKIEEFNKNPELLKSSSSLPFSSILGEQIFSHPNSGTVPGIMTIYWTPSMGNGSYPEAWNKSAQEIFAYMVHANSRTYAQDYTDYSIAMLAGSEIFSAIEDARRVYGVMKSFTEANSYLVDNLVTAMGFNPKDIRRNLSNMWNDINDMIVATKDVWIPNVCPLFERYLDFNTYVYTDAPGERSQIYVFVRKQYFMYSGIASDQGSMLLPALYPTYISQDNTTEWGPWKNLNRSSTSDLLTWAQFRQMVYNMIKNLLGAQDIGRMYGNMMNAYGPDKILALQVMTNDYVVHPVYNAERLMQIENLTVSSMWPMGFGQIQGVSSSAINVAAGPTLVQLWPYDEKTASATPNRLTAPPVGESLLNVHVASQPSPEAIMEATRLKTQGFDFINATSINSSDLFYNADNISYFNNNEWATYKEETGNIVLYRNYVPRVSGSEIVTGVTIWSKTTSSTDITPFSEVTPEDINCNIITNGSGATSITTALFYQMMRLMAFDWHPFVYQIFFNNGSAGASQNRYNLTTTVNTYGDFDNYTVVNIEELRKMSNAAFYSLWGIPQSAFDHKYLR